jgi:membrane-associated protease RseP (regulator of RpoE activity)
MKPWQPLLLLLPFFQAAPGADVDPFSSTAKLELTLPTRALGLKLESRITQSSALSVLTDRKPIRLDRPLVPMRAGIPVMVDTVDPFRMQKEGQGRIVNGTLPQEIVPKEIVGIGLALRIDPLTGFPQIVGVVPNSPAAAAGLSSGDTIYVIDDASTEGQDLATSVSLIRGREDTPVRLQIARRGQELPLSVELFRKKVPPQQ